MTNFSFLELAKELDNANEEGITFEDQQLNWNTAEDVAEVVNALKNKKVVHFLKLDGNTLGVEAAAAISKALETHPEFRKALWLNMFTRRLKTEIPKALEHLGRGLIVAKAQLTVLDLSDNALGPNGMVGLEGLLRSSVCYTLQELRLNNCGLGIGGGEMLSKAILDCHSLSTKAGKPLSLKVFITGRNRLENNGAKAIAQIFSKLKTLEEIQMPQNSIYHNGIAALAESFKENPNLRVLNLNDNTIKARGASSLAAAFTCTPNLRVINIAECLLKTNGAYIIAEALEEQKHLEVIDLSYNEINSDGAIVIAKAIHELESLKELNLDGNAFTKEGIDSLVDLMASATCPNALGSLEDNEDFDGEEEEEDDDDENEDDDDEEAEEEDYNASNDDENCENDEEEFEEEDEDEEDDHENYEVESDDEPFISTKTFVSTVLSPDASFNSASKSMFNVNPFSEVIPEKKSPTSENFCLNQSPCTLEMFESLTEQDKLKSFKIIIDKFSGDTRIILHIFTALKCAHLCKSSAEAMEIAKTLFKDIIDHAINNKEERRIVNYILIQLGLLQSEEKFKSDYDKKSCRHALRETLKTYDISNEYIKNTFNVFLQQVDD